MIVAFGITVALEGFLDGLWVVVGTGIVHGTALALLTLLLTRTVLRNARPALIAALWTIVLCKFLVPLGPEVPVSLSGALDAVWASDAELVAQSGALPTPDTTPIVAPAATGPDLWLFGRLGLFGLYLFIVGWLLVRKVRRQLEHRRWVAAQPPVSGLTLEIAARAGRTIGLRQTPNLRVSADAVAPHIVGAIRPVVIVPEAAVLALTTDSDTQTRRAAHTLEAMLLHEFAHLRRLDTWWRALQLFASALFFFWPVVGWVNRRIDEHREMACDQWALAHGKLNSGEYARALVAAARRANTRPGGSASASRAAALGGIVLGMAPSRPGGQLHSRVDALMGARRRPRLGIASGLLLSAYAVVCLGSASSASERIADSGDECVIEPGLVEYILVTYPEADIDGDGELSRDEVCAQKKRLEERGVFDDDTAQSPKFASTMPYDAVLASLDPSKFECQACGCGLGELETDASTLQQLDKKICSTSSN